MEIKKKIAVWCALFALLVTLVPPSSAKANEKNYSFEDWCFENGYEYKSSSQKSSYDVQYSFDLYDDSSDYILFQYQDKIRLVIINTLVNEYESTSMYYFSNGYLSSKTDTGKVMQVNVLRYDYNTDGWTCWDINRQVNVGGGSMHFTLSADDVLYTSVDIYSDSALDSVVVNKTVSETYSFKNWCYDADLNCQASSNESASVIPYSYNDYWHIVRKTSSGNWLLTTIGSNLGQAKMSLRLTEDNSQMMIYEFSGDDTVAINVRQYEYDTDGWKVRTYDTYSYDDFTSGILTLGVGTGIDSTRMIAYANTPIYSSDGLSVSIPVSSEYYEVEMPDIPEQEVTPTPTPAPSGGYDVITYNPTLEASVIADSVYMRELPSSDSVAVGAFIKTWHVNVHGYCRDNDGVIWYLCSTVRDDIDYTGYIMAKYVKLESYGDIVIDFGDIDIEDIPSIVDSAKESVLSILGLVGVVPMMIGAVFGFLPSWCLLMVGATVVVMCIVGIIKVFRG